jgi:acyl-coenzyme A synthetase/AMP-(fatty) acid ligase/thioester reductase-like protein
VKQVHIITGANGYLGSHLALEILATRPDDRVVCLARADDRSARERVLDAVTQAAHTCGQVIDATALARMEVVDANPLRANPGLGERLRERIGEASTFWHVAATVRFTESEPGELDRINSDGAMHALDIAIEAGCSAFNYVSTAYVAGDRSGTIEARMEDAPPNAFSNPYERSKFDAERRVRQRAGDAGLDWRVLRPSIIVGHSRTGLSASDSGLYKFCEMLDEFWSGLRQGSTAAYRALRMAAPAGAHLNFVPVDLCVEEMLAIDADPASRHGVFHLVSRTTVTTADFLSAVAEASGVPISAETPEALAEAPLNRREVEFARRVWHYQPYLVGNKTFDRAGTVAACGRDLQAGFTIDRDAVQGWLRTFLRRRWALRDAPLEAHLFSAQRGMPVRFNLAGHLLAITATAHGDRIAIRHEGASIRYAELASRVASAARRLAEAGVHGQQRVALVSHDGIDHVVGLLAVQFLGAIAVMINPLLPNRDIAAMVEQADAAWILADAGSRDREVGSDTAARLMALEDIVAPGNDTATPVADAPLAAPTSPHDIAFAVFTSGSMGIPKLVEHRHQDPVVASDRYAAHMLDLRSSDVLFSASRTTFAFGMQNLLIALLKGATAVIAPRKISAAVIADLIAQARPTVMFAVPTIYQYLLDDAALSARIAQNSLRLCIAAGERLPQAVATRWFQRHGIRLLDSLGSSEAFSTYLSNVADVEHNNATGKLVPGFDAVLRHEDGSPCRIGERGVMWLRGPSLSVSARDRAAGGLVDKGWYCTKDVFWRDADGYFYFCGRSDEMFKVAGQWVSPLDLEEVLLSHPAVREVAVTASGNDDATLRTKAWVVSDIASDALADELRALCKARLDGRRYPHLVEFVEALPRTSTGKLQRAPLRQRDAESAPSVAQESAQAQAQAHDHDHDHELDRAVAAA